jgi:stage III sporulation protein AH
MKKFLSNFKKHKKTIITLAFAAAVTTLIYADPLNFTSNSAVSDYLYNKDYSESGTKILGEAALVDSKTDLYDNQDRYFSTASLNREKSRDEALQTLQVVVDSAEELPETRDKALSEILEIATSIEVETIVEEMIKAKGFEDCVAIISGDNINVIVKSDGLLTSEVAQITDIVKSETGFGPENIRIVEKI